MQLGLIAARAQQYDRYWLHGMEDGLKLGKLADELGISSCYFETAQGHGTSGLNPTTALLSQLAQATKRLQIGLDVAAIGQDTPESVAKSTAMLDQMLDGRLFLGTTADKRPEDLALEAATAAWRAEATNIEPTVQYPHPEILSFSETGSPTDVSEAASKGYRPVSASWMASKELAAHWPALVSGATRSMCRVAPRHWHVERSIFICEDADKARDYVLAANSPYRKYYESLLRRIGRLDQLETILRDVVIYGPASYAIDRLSALQEFTGAFGNLHYIDHTWIDPDLAKSSLIAMVEKVMPALGSTATPKQEKLEIQ